MNENLPAPNPNRKKPYSWKKEAKFGKAVLLVSSLVLGTSIIEANTNNVISKSVANLFNPQAHEESIGNLVDSETFVVPVGGTIEAEALEAYEKMVSKDGTTNVPQSEISIASQKAQYENNDKHVTYPGDAFTETITKNGNNFDVSIEPKQ